MSNMTAVEWLLEEWPILQSQIPTRIIDQAKEIGKEQIEDVYGHGQNNGYMYANSKAITIRKDQYYNATFKGNK